MIRGRVNQYQQALITIDIMDSADSLQSLEVVLDTGFTGYLTLPPDAIQRLGLPSAGYRIFELASGGAVRIHYLPRYGILAWTLG